MILKRLLPLTLAALIIAIASVAAWKVHKRRVAQRLVAAHAAAFTKTVADFETYNNPNIPPPTPGTYRYIADVPSYLSLRPVVTKEITSTTAHFLVDIKITPNDDEIPGMAQSDLVTVYASKLVAGRHGSPGDIAMPDGIVPDVKGHWNIGDTVHLDFTIPIKFADPQQSWNLTACIGKKDGCLPTPNLLTGTPIQGRVVHP